MASGSQRKPPRQIISVLFCQKKMGHILEGANAIYIDPRVGKKKCLDISWIRYATFSSPCPRFFRGLFAIWSGFLGRKRA